MNDNNETPMIPKHQHQAEMMHLSRAIKAMMVLYEYLHEKHIGTAMQIKIKQSMYKA